MSAIGDPPHDFRILRRVLSKHKECCLCLIPVQNIQDTICELRMRAIIERERGDTIGSLNRNKRSNDLPYKASHHSAQRFYNISDYR
jgi:hypothetical protein